MKARNSISCTLTTPSENNRRNGNDLRFTFDDKYNFYALPVSTHEFRKQFQFHIAAPPSKRRRGAKNKTKQNQEWSEERREKFNVWNSSGFGLHTWIHAVCVCSICVFGVLVSFVGSFFTSILHFWALLSTNSLGLRLDWWWHMAHRQNSLLFSIQSNQRRFFLHVIGVFFLSSCIVVRHALLYKSEKKVCISHAPETTFRLWSEFMNISGH